jgi:hypothetical protein
MSLILQLGKGKFRIDLDQTELHRIDGGVCVAGSGPGFSAFVVARPSTVCAGAIVRR